MDPVTLHSARATRAIRPRSPRHRATLVRETAARDGWAYVTMRSGPGVRVVIEVAGSCGLRVGDAHMDLDTYTDAESAV